MELDVENRVRGTASTGGYQANSVRSRPEYCYNSECLNSSVVVRDTSIAFTSCPSV